MMRRFFQLGAVFMSAGTWAGAQGAPASFDRTKAPKLSKPARLVVPPVAVATLPNGVRIRVVEQHELPLVQVIVSIDGGARLDGDTPGMATFMAGLLDDGAGARDAAALQSELAYLGANLTTGASWDGYSVSLKVALRSLGPALDLLADVVQRPAFLSAEVKRQRDLRLAGFLQTRDRPEAVASLAFNQAVYPSGHPYHRATSGDSVTTARFDSARVRAFYASSIRPERTTFIVVGDVDLARARQEIASRFDDWRPTGPALATPAITVPATARTTSRVYFVDKPEAAQSVIHIGWPGVDRHSPDYAALMVMNTVLGGSFTSRLNMNLRESKGYSYGARSGFAFRKNPGPFSASASVRTDVTDSSLVEFFRELRAIRAQPVSAEELERAKNYVELQLPGDLETTTDVAGQLLDLQTFGLSLSELPRYAAAVRRVTAADVQRVARQYLTPDRATIVVVGDLAKVRARVDALGLGVSDVWEVRNVVR
jgi:predicted Zn-dependent peptidase